MKKALIISGPTGVGKTGFALEMAKKFDGELVSADSRQVYEGMDIVTGKDLPESVQCSVSSVQWRGRNLKYYEIQGIKVWLYDVVSPDEEFNVSFWRECAQKVIEDILRRNKLPIIVGGTGLYVRSLTENLSGIDIPFDPELRNQLEGKDAEYLFDYLKRITPQTAQSLNESDRKNPRRLIRKIEISGQPQEQVKLNYEFLQIGLTAPLEEIDRRIGERVKERIDKGAREEFDKVRSKYNLNLPSLTASGYRDWDNWPVAERQYARRQLTWFKKFGQKIWYDICQLDWKSKAESAIFKWYAAQD